MMRLAILLSLVVVTAAAQSSSVPYDQFGGPLYSIKSVDVSQPSHARTIRDVDFRNMWVFEPGGSRLKNGRYNHENREEMFFESIELASVYYLAPSYALVLYLDIQGGGSSTNSAIAQLFTLSKRRLALVQRITWDTDATRSESSPRLYSSDAATNTLVIRSSHYLPGDAHCCISAVDVVTFAWKDTHFEKVAVNTELSEDVKREGKRLR